MPMVQVPVSSAKSHATIWGKAVKRIEDIPSPAASQVLGSIVAVQGITEIKLGPFGHKGSRTRCQALVGESKTPHVIEGKLFDKGSKGTMQSFQVWVQSDEAKLSVMAEIESALRCTAAWAG